MSTNERCMKFVKKHSLLADPECARKQLEKERRLLRLKQVRDESKKLARRIRERVAEEQVRQMQKLAQLQMQERTRHNGQEHKYQDNNVSSIFQVGAAQRAAQAENEILAQRRRQREQKMEKCRQRAANVVKHPSNKAKLNGERQKGLGQIAGTQTKPQNDRDGTSDMDLAVGCREKSNCSCQHSDDELLSVDRNDSLDDSTHSEETLSESSMNVSLSKKSGKVELQKNPIIVLDVSIDSDESVVITLPGVDDRHIVSNRAYSRVFRDSEDVNNGTKTNNSGTPACDSKNSFQKEQLPGAERPHFTQISDLMRRKKGNEPLANIASDDILSAPQGLRSSDLATQMSPLKAKRTSLTSASKQTPPALPHTHSNVATKLRKEGSIVAKTIKNTAATLDLQEIANANEDPVSEAPRAHVKFYDHHNRFQSHYVPANQVVSRENPCELTARDHAGIENELQLLRHKELDKLRSITEARSKKAIEREEVRRDYAELTAKLDALTRDHPHILPTDADFKGTHRYQDQTTRMQSRMNAIFENMLLEPAVITCSETEAVNSVKKNLSKGRPKANVVNVARGGNINAVGRDTITSDSCCSMLLDLVDDQSKQVRADIKDYGANSEKTRKLKDLLVRIENIRGHLVNELNTQCEEIDDADAQTVIDSIRSERAKILEDKERQLKKREDIIEQKMRELYDAQKSANKKSNRPNVDDLRLTPRRTTEKTAQKAVEIVIKVQSDGQIQHYTSKTEKIDVEKSRGKPEKKAAKTSSLEPGKLGEELSYDSASTSYRSLPPTIGNKVNEVVAELGVQSKQHSNTNNDKQRDDHSVHPLVAQYVHKLLSLDTKSVEAIREVTVSDVPTPSTSVLNTPSNKKPTAENTRLVVNESQMESVRSFIEDNRNLVSVIEDTIITNRKEIDEASMRQLKEAWEKRYRKRVQRNAASIKVKPKLGKSSKKSPAAPSPDGIMEQKLTRKRNRVSKKQCTTAQVMKSDFVMPEISGSDSLSTEAQLEKYNELAGQCVKRIANITELIDKVQEEKRRLLEITLTSASDGERHSTEYLELPAATAEPMVQIPVSCDENSHFNQRSILAQGTQSIDSDQLAPRHKVTGKSYDSGISVLRPITSHDQPAEFEPQSQVSSNRSPTAPQRRHKHSPTALNRYSPDEGDKFVTPHELSTILEADTTTQSQTNAGTKTTLSATAAGATFLEHLKIDKVQDAQALQFPTFEQYANTLQLDLSNISQDQSLILQREFNAIVESINRQFDKQLGYKEFPSLNAYLKDITAQLSAEVQHLDHSGPLETVKGIIESLRIANQQINEFPTIREYLHRLRTEQPNKECELIECSSSMEYISGDCDRLQAKTSNEQSVGQDSKLHHAHQSQISSPARSSSSLSSEIDQLIQHLRSRWVKAMRQKSVIAPTDSTDTGDNQRHSEELPPNTSEIQQQVLGDNISDDSSIGSGFAGIALNLQKHSSRCILRETLKGRSVVTVDRQKTSTPKSSTVASSFFTGDSQLSSVVHTTTAKPIGANNSQNDDRNEKPRKS